MTVPSDMTVNSLHHILSSMLTRLPKYLQTSINLGILNFHLIPNQIPSMLNPKPAVFKPQRRSETISKRWKLETQDQPLIVIWKITVRLCHLWKQQILSLECLCSFILHFLSLSLYIYAKYQLVPLWPRFPKRYQTEERILHGVHTTQIPKDGFKKKIPLMFNRIRHLDYNSPVSLLYCRHHC